MHRPPLNATQFSPASTGVPDELPARIVSKQTAKGNGSAAAVQPQSVSAILKKETLSKHFVRPVGANHSSRRQRRRRDSHARVRLRNNKVPCFYRSFNEDQLSAANCGILPVTQKETAKGYYEARIQT